MEEAAPCACKGIRSCLICESSDKRRQRSSNNNNSLHNRELVLEFDPALGLAVAPPGSALAGLATRVSGVHVWRDFLSPEEETQLVAEIDRDEWRPSQSGRRKQDYGPKVNFRKRRVRAAGFSGLPPLGRALARRVRAASPELLGDFVPVEQCHLEYEPSRGASIDAHLDDAWLWGDRLVTVNLLSDTALTLTRPSAAGGARGTTGDGRAGVGQHAEGGANSPRSEAAENLDDGTVGTRLLGGAGELDGDGDADWIVLRPVSFWQQRRSRQNLSPGVRPPPASTANAAPPPRPQSDPETGAAPVPESAPDYVSVPPGGCARVPAASVAVRVPSPRRSLVLLRGEARGAWLHAVRRGDVSARRVCVTLRELSRDFRPEPRALARLARAALGPEPGAAATDGPAEPGDEAEEPLAAAGGEAQIGARLLATALTFRGTPVR